MSVLSLLATACASFRSTQAPIPTVTWAAGDGPAPCLLVLLPGRGDRPERFGKAGFPERARQRGLRLDVVAVDAHMGYYQRRTLVDRLREDVVGPARARGQQVWLAGVSLGGLGSLVYTSLYREDVAGIVALAPFLGTGKVVREIAAAGGPMAWTPPGPVAADDFERELWVFLKGYGAGDPSLPPLHLLWGEKDYLATGIEMLAGMLPPEHRTVITGGHDWPTWQALWDRFLDTGALKQACR